MSYNYEELKLKLELFEFSQYKKLDENMSKINFKDIKNELKAYRISPKQDKKYITIFLVSNDKIIKRIDKSLDKFKLQIFKQYKNEKSNLKVVCYIFDTTNKQSSFDYQKFLYKNTFFNITESLQNGLSIFKQKIIPLLGLLSAFLLLFTYLGVSEHGIPSSYIADTPIIAFLLMASFTVFAGLLVVLYLGIIFLLIPLILCVIFDCFAPIPFGLILISYLLIFYIYFTNKFPLLVYEYHRLLGFLAKLLVIVLPSFSALIIGFYIIQSILSSYYPNNNFYGKSMYTSVILEYQARYSGYPKILKRDGKEYYVPVKDARYYYVYDIKNVKKRYFNDLSKGKQDKLSKICMSSQIEKEFIDGYILNNKYIKPKYLTLHFSINDTSIIIEDFNKSKLINFDDIDELCNNYRNREKNKV